MILSLIVLKRGECKFNQEIEGVFKIISISKSDNLSGVNVGDYVLNKIDNLHQLEGKFFDGVTIYLNRTKNNILKVLDKYTVHIVNKYKVYDNIVYDCKFYGSGILGFKTMQICVKDDYVEVGLPSILNGF